MAKLDLIVQQIEQATGHVLKHYQLKAVGGGSINTSYQLMTNTHNYFIKLNKPNLVDMFEAEARGLDEMRALNCVRIPEVICFGQTDDHSYIVLEYIELGGLHGQASKLLGAQLAQLHNKQQSFFGWHIDNTIGSTPQHNDCHHDWITFYKEQRLEKQLLFAKINGFTGKLQERGQQLIENLPYFFDNYSPQPSLLHGDLWGGNAAADQRGDPVIFDPACYYGDREADIAMTELFGGFNSDFYTAYQTEYSLDHGYKTRKTLYNLYHILNHLNLFGGGYLSQSERMIDQLLAES